MKKSACGVILALWIIVECIDAKKYCWYFEGGYPIYFICRSYEDCCGTRCCVRALSVQRLWYFWLLLMVGVLFCCGAGFFIRRRMYPSPLSEEPAFNVSFTRHPGATPGVQLPAALHYRDVEGMRAPLAPAYPGQPNAGDLMTHYPPPPSYCSHPPPPYEQVLRDSEKK
ncbi:hypothetical protein COCON_G00136950 [Conger conger]|uniref:WW domain binding protein VOPP1 n=1 Tax=Conger conger TaxID=82655 RepID=A0A9Q1HW11_CONCO|nr:WW domain binding protein VOPP1-like [Conger conger]KAJ8268523.1 hypothetical protein COCON_G00136950 [Conger conger]